jgi:spore germination protein PF
MLIGMPSFIGVFKVVSNNGNLVNGDTLVVSPSNSSKTYAGAGHSTNGDFSVINTLISATNTSDPDVIEAGGNKVATGT